MLTASAASNTSGKSVTTLIVSIGLFHGDEMVPPRLHHRPRRDPDEPEQPFAVVGPPPRHDERPRDDLPLLVHHVQPGARHEPRARILHQGKHRYFLCWPCGLRSRPTSRVVSPALRPS